MVETKLEINSNCELICTTYDSFPTDVSLDYIEYATGYGQADTHTSIDMDKEMAVKIIEFLKQAFSITQRTTEEKE